MNVAYMTFGCRLNRAEALDEEARLSAAGHTLIPLGTGPTQMGTGPEKKGTAPEKKGTNPKQVGPGPLPPDVIIVRCCSVTAKAQRDCEKTIKKLQFLHPQAQIILTGCHPNAHPIPLSGIGLSSPQMGTGPERTGSTQMGTDPERMGTGPLSTPIPLKTSRAYLKVQDGCSGKCAFCIVPQFRGSPRSVPFEHVLARAQVFLSAGFRELVVTGCNLALYRNVGKGLPELLTALAQLSPTDSGTDPTKMGTGPTVYLGTGPEKMGTGPFHRIRLGSIEPGICDSKLLSVLAKTYNICSFLHLSLQSASNHVLKSMNRPYTIEQVSAFCQAAQQTVGKRLAFGVDLIAGFPGETLADHEETCRFLSEWGQAPNQLAPNQLEWGQAPQGVWGQAPNPFVNLHVFPYSERPGTPAATMPGAVPRAERLRRARELEAIGHANRLRFAAGFLNQEVEVCVEKDGNGWTSEYFRCLLPPGLPRRRLVKARVTAVTADVLTATDVRILS